jgi:hypothetical protein
VNYGVSAPLSASVAVPEPASVVLAMLLIGQIFNRRRS